MKLEQITLENFGVFGCRLLEFGAAPLVLVFGASDLWVQDAHALFNWGRHGSPGIRHHASR